MRAAVNSKWFPREPVYDHDREDRLLAERMDRAQKAASRADHGHHRRKRRALVHPMPLPVGQCRPHGIRRRGRLHGLPDGRYEVGNIRERMGPPAGDILVDIPERARSKDGSRHDCIIAVSGGKDSHFQTHYIKNVLGFNPLLVTYYGNNFTDAGQRNLFRMKDTFGVDHVIYQPSVDVLRKLNRLGFKIMGDMNYHNHIGICTVPMRVAVQHKIPVVIWGEHGYADLCGQYSMNDFVEWTYRNRLEHYCRGFEWNYMLGREGLTARDMIPYQYPSDQEIFDLDLRGIHLSNYVYWEANEHGKMVQELYDFEVADEPFDRTYRTMSNLDDMHENGVHDYMKFVKLGYGRCTDHASKDVRANLLSRGQAVDLVRKHDHVKPRDLAIWLEYTGMSEEEFDAIADTFRDPRVWRYEDGDVG